MHSIIKKRIQQLETLIDEHSNLLFEYEHELLYSSDPRERLRCQNEIEKIGKMIENYRAQYNDLVNQVKAAPTTEPKSEEAPDLALVGEKLDRLEHSISVQFEKLGDTMQAENEKLQSTLLTGFDEKHQLLVDALIKRLDQSQVEMIRELIFTLERRQLSAPEQRYILQAVKLITEQLPAVSFPQGAALRRVLEDPSVGMSHKIKISLPILPAVLAYEGEITLDGKMNPKELIGKIIAKIRGENKKDV